MKTINLFKLANNLKAFRSCNDEWKTINKQSIEKLETLLPHGSGFDGTMEIDVNKSKDNLIVIEFEFHFMDENGYYDGWETYKLKIIPSFQGYNLKIVGKNRNQIKDYFYDVFYAIFIE